MPKPNPLTQGLNQQQAAPNPRKEIHAPAVASLSSRKRGAPSRAGKRLIGGHFAPEVNTALRVIAAQENTTLQALLAEGINMVFAKRHKPEIADISAN